MSYKHSCIFYCKTGRIASYRVLIIIFTWPISNKHSFYILTLKILSIQLFLCTLLVISPLRIHGAIVLLRPIFIYIFCARSGNVYKQNHTWKVCLRIFPLDGKSSALLTKVSAVNPFCVFNVYMKINKGICLAIKREQ